MATIPIVPTFTDGDSDIADLQALSDAVSFLVDCDVRPTWHTYKTATQSITATTATSVIFGTTAFDSDGVANGTGITIVTPGYYRTEACLQIECTVTAEQYNAWFKVTFGANNPNYSSGVTKIYGARGTATSSQTNTDAARVISAICPYALYPGDEINPQVYVGVSMTLDNNSNTGYAAGRFVCNFTGKWIAAYSGYTPPTPQTYLNGFTMHGATGDFTAQVGKGYYIMPSSNISVQLPSAADATPSAAMIFKTTSSTYTVTMVPVAGEHINNLPNAYISGGASLGTAGDGVWVFRDTNGWWAM